MTVTLEELDGFHRFALDRVKSSESELTLEDLVVEWDSRRNREEINAAIREGLADTDAGRTRSAAEAVAELREKHGLSE